MGTDHLFDKYYFSRAEFVDGTTEFHNLIGEQVERGSSLLEIGPGPANQTTGYLATLGRVVGVDITPELNGNGALAEAHIFDGLNLPFPDGHFDACVSNWVLEHVPDPSFHFREVARVLRPGGSYCLRTPNRWHYFAVASRLTPFGVHVHIANKLRGMAADAHSPYPTYYRANTAGRISQLCSQSGLVPAIVSPIEKEPSYGRFHPALFYPMYLYERCVNSHSSFKGLRASILAVLRKPIAFEKNADTRNRVSKGPNANTRSHD